MRPETERVCFCLVSKIFAGLSISDYGGRSQQKKGVMCKLCKGLADIQIIAMEVS
jgi:hypothetical protein